QHADGGNTDSVEALGEGGGIIGRAGGQRAAGGQEGDDNARAHNENGGDGGQHAEGETADDGGGGAGLGGSGQALSGLICIRSVILGKVADGTAADKAAQNGHIHAPVAQG